MILRNKHALSYIASLCFAYGGMFTFITASPSVYMGYFGVSESIYPFLFGAIFVTMILFNRLNIALLHKHAPQALLTLGQLIQLVTALVLYAYVTYVDTLSLTVTVGLIMIFIGAQSFVVSNANACTVEFFPTNSGTATALLGAAGFGTGALAGTLVGLFGDGTPMPMVTIMLLAILLGLTFRYLFFRFIDKTQ
jgi:DHA1 family bicyclomycin/chloramphenicol resistance-like MFS transporter